jgi:hypothetical protein
MEGNTAAVAPVKFPSWEGSGVDSSESIRSHFSFFRRPVAVSTNVSPTPGFTRALVIS